MIDPYDRRLGYSGARGPGPLTKVLAVVAGVTMLVVGLMFSVVLLGVALVVGTVAGGWLWWKTRALRRDLRAQMQRMQGDLNAAMNGPSRRPDAQAGGPVIDGDFIRERRAGRDPSGRP